MNLFMRFLVFYECYVCYMVSRTSLVISSVEGPQKNIHDFWWVFFNTSYIFRFFFHFSTRWGWVYFKKMKQTMRFLLLKLKIETTYRYRVTNVYVVLQLKMKFLLFLEVLSTVIRVLHFFMHIKKINSLIIIIIINACVHWRSSIDVYLAQTHLQESLAKMKTIHRT